MPVRIAVVCEAAADKRTACTLADRVLGAHRGVSELTELDAMRQYGGLEQCHDFVAWSKVESLAKHLRSKVHGHMSGQPAEADARMARRVLRLIQLEHADVGAVLLIRDSDGRADRRNGLEQARTLDAWSFAVIIGLAEAKREAWLLAAFEPAGDAEKQVLAELRQELGFDPRMESHALTAKQDDAKRSAKRVWAKLSPGGDESCIETTPLDTLHERGRENGLAAYLGDVKFRLGPITVGE